MPSSRQEGSPRALSIASSLGRAAQVFLPRRHRFRRNLSDSDVPHPVPPVAGRAVTEVFNVCRQLDPDGLGVRRASSSVQSDVFSPFLLLDHCGPHRVGAAKEICGQAPRCGQQVLTYVVRGEMHYRDSCGNDSVLHPGCVNLLTAGSGLAVSHSLRGPIIEYLSIWINIPREVKSAPPEQRMTGNPPYVTIGQGESSARIAVLAGPGHRNEIPDFGDARKRETSAELETAAGKAAVYDVRMQRKSKLVLNPETQRVFVYVYRGAAIIGKKVKVVEGDFAVLEQNKSLPLVIDSYGVHRDTNGRSSHDFTNFEQFEEHGCWCLVLAGDPVMEPVSMLSSGIVACTPKEIRKAFQDYTCGSLGASGLPGSNSAAALSKCMEESDDESTVEDDSDSVGPDTDGDVPDVGFGKLDA